MNLEFCSQDRGFTGHPVLYAFEDGKVITIIFVKQPDLLSDEKHFPVYYWKSNTDFEELNMPDETTQCHTLTEAKSILCNIMQPPPDFDWAELDKFREFIKQ